MHFVRGTTSSTSSNGIGSVIHHGAMHHHTPPIPVEPAVAPVPVLEQESVLDLSRRPVESTVPSDGTAGNETNESS